MILCCEYLSGCFCQVPLSPRLKMSYVTSNDENSSHHKLEKKRYDILMVSEKTIYIDIGYKLGSELKPASDKRVLKIRRLL